jgi:hypothetical protein
MTRDDTNWRNDVARCRYGPEFSHSLLDFRNGRHAETRSDPSPLNIEAAQADGKLGRVVVSSSQQAEGQGSIPTVMFHAQVRDFRA